ncbi:MULTISPECIES: trypsin-like serine peptidase [Myxococcus]|uniref:trypsin-like serine peptidase n=1 Tax=Myxococcus TaxID=32 RepID=UPI0013D1FC6E|nr:trypsin-like peptidase domain-containing protein [Myxococcus eversor]NVJ22440.1 trypsin-like peptidase domain-containing protein [Myxococcus sp. AM011]
MAKLVYTAALATLGVGFGFLFYNEFTRVWLDKNLYIGKFELVDMGEEKSSEAKSFPRLVATYHKTLLYLLRQEAQRLTTAQSGSSAAGNVAGNTPLPDSTFLPKEVDPLNIAASKFSEVELTIQGVNVTQLLAKIRQWVSTPNELVGTVQKSSSGVRVEVNWKQGPSRTAAGHPIDGQTLNVSGQPDIEKAAFHVACGLIWAQGATSAEDLAAVSRAEFCGWAEGWTTYIDLRERSATLSGLGADSIETMKKLRAFLNRMVDGSATFPEVYRLRADVIELLPPEQKTEQDLAQAQGDRTKYALMKTQTPSAKAALAARKTGHEAFKVMAQARPALRLQGDAIIDPLSDTWKQVMKSTRSEPFTISRATGSLSIPIIDDPQDRKAYQTAFAVAPNIIMTVGHKIPREMLGHESPVSLPAQSWEFTFDDNARSPMEHVHHVTRILFAVDNTPGYGGLSFALLEIASHDSLQHPYVKLEWNKDAVRAHLEKYVYVVGYPVSGGNLPQGFIDPLLGNEFSTKRLMPGRLLSFTPQRGLEHRQVRKLVSDISTTHGVSGAPLVDMESDTVLGLHIEGLWKENEGKFAYAFAMPDLLDILPESVLQIIKPGTIRDIPTQLGQASP